MNPKRMLEQFKNMSLGKQSIIVICTISLIVLVLSSYKNVKKASVDFVDSITKDETIKEFMVNMETLVKRCAKALRDVIGLEEQDGAESKPEKQQLND